MDFCYCTIIKILNIKPSPLLGKILEELHEAQLNGEVLNYDDAVDFIKGYNLYNK